MKRRPLKPGPVRLVTFQAVRHRSLLWSAYFGRVQTRRMAITCSIGRWSTSAPPGEEGQRYEGLGSSDFSLRSPGLAPAIPFVHWNSLSQVVAAKAPNTLAPATAALRTASCHGNAHALGPPRLISLLRNNSPEFGSLHSRSRVQPF
jgi:hypothetical protein